MSGVSPIGLKNPDWDLYKGKYEAVDSLPFMGSPGPVLVVLALYLLFILKAGPSFMRKRQPFRLKYMLIYYNAAQVGLSAFMVYMYQRHLIEYGLLHSKCLIEHEPARTQIVHGVYLYFIAKVTELLDTVFFILRKKDSQVTFLHVYHHSIMMVGTWVYLKYSLSDNVVYIGFINSLVHVFMYGYYGLAALGPGVAKHLWWKRYMTSFQLIQFFSILLHYFASVVISECPPSKGVYYFFVFNILAFIVMFANFYTKSYLKQRKGSIKNGGLNKGVSRGSTNGVSNGSTNGGSNGSTNGVSNGSTGGVANGSTNGVANGSTNGISKKTICNTPNGIIRNGIFSGICDINSSIPNGEDNRYKDL